MDALDPAKVSRRATACFPLQTQTQKRLGRIEPIQQLGCRWFRD